MGRRREERGARSTRGGAPVSRCRDCHCEVESGVLRCDRCAHAYAEAEFDAGYSLPGPTLTAALAARGYTHRATPTAITSGKRAILRDGGHEVVAELTAHEAWAWLRGGER